MSDDSYDTVSGVVKTVIHGGGGEVAQWKKNTKVQFHYRASRLCDGGKDLSHFCDECKLLDDTRTMGGGPFELLIGREFKLPVWELCLKSMRVGEVSAFNCNVQHCINYSFVSSLWRNVSAKRLGQSDVPPAPSTGCCASMMNTTGHADLDEFNAAPAGLRFQFELVSALAPDKHEREGWALTRDEKEVLLPALRGEGKRLFSAGDYVGALEKYRLAVSYCHDVTMLDVRASEHWSSVMSGVCVPLLVNTALCLKQQREFAQAAECCTKALEISGEHVKATFVRATALQGCWRLAEARADYLRAQELDPDLQASVAKKLAELDRLEQEKTGAERTQYRRMFQS
ncbi:AH receptor-interacting protein-like [Sycon ciliatum]|uniref:AH receptor-interacting protein-like n=1 Tax=Sycon ciliatum TaxID=27933 RepID=UPI0031F6DA95